MSRRSRRRRNSAPVYLLLILTVAAIAYVVWSRLGAAPVLSTEAMLTAAQNAVSDYQSAQKIDPRVFIYDVNVVQSGDVVSITGVVQDRQTETALMAAVRAAAGRGVKNELRVLPDAAMSAKPFGIVSVPVANLGDGPKSDTGKHMVTQAVLGNVVDLLEETSGWYRVRMHDDYLGWIDGKSLTIGDRAMVDSFTGGRQAVITAKFATIHATPDAASPGLTAKDAVQGTVLPVTAEQDGWVGVKLPDGRSGWLNASSVRLAADIKDAFPRGSATDIIATAKQYVGLAYLWGGTTGYGFDCSGLTQFAYRVNGYAIPRDADMQYNAGQVLNSRDELRPGDLVFFSTYKAGPSHVGIYMGNNLYVHSASSGLQISSFDPKAPEYSQDLDQKYFGARRFIK
ncbi:MAG: NlpC/P60 family protein [Chloroflexota bacterium]